VIEALRRVVGPAGTLVMPAQSSGLSEPEHWRAPPVPVAWWPTIRAHLPAFDPELTPSRGMGVVAECLRVHPASLRGRHPTCSFSALGPRAEQVVGEQPLDDPFGDASPLARLHELQASILLLGVGYDCCTSLHLAERRAFADRQLRESTGSPLLVDGRRAWVEYEVPDLDSSDFERLGEAFEAETGAVRVARVAAGQGRLMPLSALVDYAVPWLTRHRSELGAVPRLPGRSA
jgi:aminoglycoside 3-N-acetyltransferase